MLNVDGTIDGKFRLRRRRGRMILMMMAATQGSNSASASVGVSLTAPTLVWEDLDDPTADNTPSFTIGLTAPAVDDVVRLVGSTQGAYNPDVGPHEAEDTYTVLAADLIDLECEFLNIGALADGAWDFYARLERGATVSAWSTVQQKTITAAPSYAGTYYYLGF